MSSKEREQKIRKAIVKNYLIAVGLLLLIYLIPSIILILVLGLIIIRLLAPGGKYLYNIKKNGENEVQFEYLSFLLKKKSVRIEKGNMSDFRIKKRMLSVINENDFCVEMFEWVGSIELIIELKEELKNILSSDT